MKPLGRLAPSPTGYLHLGNARSFLLAWLQVRALGGRIVLRIEDLDQARAVPNRVENIVRDLTWLGLDWDNELTSEFVQSHRFDLYHSAIKELQQRGLSYPCFCSRKELRSIASAPHGSTGTRYPGTCRDLSEQQQAERAQHKEPALRFRVEAGTIVEFTDLVSGRVREDVAAVAGDFIIARADGVPSYQLAVVLDDIDMGITHVLRGDDLLESTARQILLFETFAAPVPTYAHVPLILAPDGQRLAKRHGSISVAELRDAGHSAEKIIGWLAHSCGLRPTSDACCPRNLIKDFSPVNIPHQATILQSLQPL